MKELSQPPLPRLIQDAAVLNSKIVFIKFNVSAKWEAIR
jgi:hypothetical protein